MKFGWFLAGFLVAASLERIYERRFSHRAVRGDRKMSWSYMALHSLHIAIFTGTFVEYLWLRREIQWEATALGLVLFAIGVVVRLTAIRKLGQYWSLHLEIRKDHRFVRDGIYSYVRHPAYLAIMLEVIGVPLVGNSYYTLALAVCAYVPLLLTRWTLEEREMIEKFGDEYRRYCKEVPAFLPWRGKCRSVSPR